MAEFWSAAPAGGRVGSFTFSFHLLSCCAVFSLPSALTCGLSMLLFGIAYIHICSVVVVTLVLILALEAGAIRLGGGAWCAVVVLGL
jgi:hypothetical protein